jgi:hypothetical protein
MESSKSTIKARFFGAHIGGTVNVFGMARYINGGVTWDENGVFKFFDGCEYHPFDEKCKLVLRPLSSITDVEAAECAKIMGYKDFMDEMRIKYTKAALRVMLTLRIEADKHWHCADYLRSINICVPFCGYEPVAEGWVILEEKIPENAPQTKKEES